MNITEIWNKTLEIIKNNINSEVSYNVHMKVTSAVSSHNSVFKISVPSTINKNIIEHRYIDLIESSLETVTGQKLKLEIIIGEEEKVEEKVEEEALPDESTNSFDEYGVNPKYTFENFVIGPSNEMARAAAFNAAKNPGHIYNPLFIYGNSGLGKTHLVHAIGNKIKDNNPNANIVYVSGEKFTNEFIKAIELGTTDKFRKRYRAADVLLIDDIHFLENKEATQEEFFHTFNELYNYGKQIVLTSDRTPQDIKTLSNRLKTRFSWGIIIDVSLPNYETRVAILQKKLQSFNLEIEKEVLEFIALNIRTSVRELEGALLQIISMSQIKQSPITKEFAEEMLISILPKDRKLTPSIIINRTALYYNVSDADIMSKIKTKEIAIPRQVAMYLCRILLNMNDTNIAREFGKDRSTVNHNVEKIEKEVTTNHNLSSAIEHIKKDIQSM